MGNTRRFLVKLSNGFDDQTGVFELKRLPVPVYSVQTKCNKTVLYKTATELGWLVGLNGLHMHNPYEPIYLECEEYLEGLYAGKEQKKLQGGFNE